MKLLIVEDNKADAYLIQEYLNSSSISVRSLDIAERLESALKYLLKNKYDAIILDLNLPDSNGIETLHEINKFSTNSAIIVLTGVDDNLLGELAIKEGAQDYIVKSRVDSNLLINSIKYSLSRLADKKSLKHINRILSSIRNINKLITHEPDKTELIRKVCKLLLQDNSYFSALIILTNKNKEIQEIAYEGIKLNEHTNELNDILFKYSNCIKEAFTDNNKIVIHSLDKRCEKCPLKEGCIGNSAMSIKLNYENKLFGLIWVSTEKEYVSDADEYSLFKELADDLSYALHNIELKSQEEKLKIQLFHSEKKFRFLAENSVNCIWQMDLRLKFIYLSPIVSEIVGYTPEFMIGTHLWKYTRKIDFIKMARFALKSIKNPNKYPNVLFESYLLHRDKYLVPVEILGKLLFNENNKIIGLQGSVRNISERKAAQEEILSKNKELKEKNKQLNETLQLTQEMNKELSIAKKNAEESAALLNAAMDNSETGIVIADVPNGKIKFINEAGLNIVGAKNKEELIELNVEDYSGDTFLLEPDGSPLSKDKVPLARAILYGEKCSREFIIKWENREEIHVWANAAPILNDINEQIAAIVIFIDITKQKKIEKEKDEYLNFLDTIIEQSPFATWIADKQGTIVKINKALREKLNVTEEEVVGKYNFLNDDNLVSHNIDFNKVFNEKRTIHFTLKWSPEKVDSVNFKDARKLWIDATIFPILNKEGEIINIACKWEDITEKVKAENNLKWEKYLTDALLTNMPDNIYFKDTESKFIRVNNAMANLFGLESTEDVLGKTDHDFFDTEHAQKAFYDEQQIIKTGIPIINKEEKETWPNKPPTWVLSTKMPLYDTGHNIIGTFGISRDITNIKLAELELLKAKEKAEENDRLKTAFLNNISHEIRTPMNAILGFSQIVKEPELEIEKRNRFLDLIVDSTNQLLTIITDIVRIATIEAGQEKLQKSEVKLDNLCESIYNQIYFKIKDTGIKLEYEKLTSENHLEIVTDETKLLQILTNLIGNAIKFTKDGGIKFGYRKNEKHVEFYVKDTGIGIEKEFHKIIFDRFRQVEMTLEREYGGSGLGLSIAKAYVEMLGGKIWLTSELKKGTTFYFNLPLELPDNLNLPEHKASNTKIENIKQISHILIAEDNANNYYLLEEILNDFDIKISWAKTGREAVEICKKQTVDLILMDIRMPEMTGTEAAKIIKSFNPEIKIIALSAYTINTSKNELKNQGFEDYLSKPIVKDVLLNKIMSI